ncbi:MAG: flagellar basal body rod protein FlgB [Myxococcota bacterium]|nr:flagellar basal body rod protein FlgB [Myxococcota bacterium]
MFHGSEDVISTMARAMRFRVDRQAVLSANVANADTPGYRRADLVFGDALAKVDVARTHSQHLAGEAGEEAGVRRVVERKAARPDGNTVNLDRELIQLSRNAGAFSEQAEVLSRLLLLRQVAVAGGR